VPDLCALGKIIGGGFSLAAVAGPRAILERTVASHTTQADLVYVSGTLNGNPVAATAGLATLDVLLNGESYGQLEVAGNSLSRGLSDVANRLSVPLQVIGVPSVLEPVFGTEPVVDYQSYLATDRRAAAAFSSEMIRRGILMRPASKIYLSTAHSDSVIDFTLEVAEEALRTVRDRGEIKT
jgi:glutamate-1-semialdehyde 2,1-aminomutase